MHRTKTYIRLRPLQVCCSCFLLSDFRPMHDLRGFHCVFASHAASGLYSMDVAHLVCVVFNTGSLLSLFRMIVKRTPSGSFIVYYEYSKTGAHMRLCTQRTAHRTQPINEMAMVCTARVSGKCKSACQDKKKSTIFRLAHKIYTGEKHRSVQLDDDDDDDCDRFKICCGKNACLQAATGARRTHCILPREN